MRRKVFKSSSPHTRQRQIAANLVGAALFVGAWELVGRAGWLGAGWLPLSHVVANLLDPDEWSVYGDALRATLGRAAMGYGLGSAAATATAFLGLLIPRLAPELRRVAVLVHAIPVIALAPLLTIALPSRWLAPVIVSALAVYFNGFVVVGAGLASARRAHDDLFTAFGAGRRVRLTRLELPVAIPAVADALRLGAPAAVLGAVIGEWFGSENGIGVLLVAGMQNLDYETLWSAALLTAVVSSAAFFLFTGIERAAAARYR